MISTAGGAVWFYSNPLMLLVVNELLLWTKQTELAAANVLLRLMAEFIFYSVFCQWFPTEVLAL